MREVVGEQARWGLTEQLLATAVDVLQAANWQRGGNKNAPKPKPIPRPGVTDTGGGRTFKSKRKYSLGEMRQILDQWGR